MFTIYILVDREPRGVYLDEKVTNFYICHIVSCGLQTEDRDFLLVPGGGYGDGRRKQDAPNCIYLDEKVTT